MNQPPDVLSPAEPNPIPLLLIADIEVIDVIAEDPEGLELLFDWSGVPSDVEIPPAPPTSFTWNGRTLWQSSYEVPRDPRLDGRPITCNIFDGDNREQVTWTVEVEE